MPHLLTNPISSGVLQRTGALGQCIKTVMQEYFVSVCKNSLSLFIGSVVVTCDELGFHPLALPLSLPPSSPPLCFPLHSLFSSPLTLHRQIDIREPHSCHGDRACRNVLIDLKLTCGASTSSTQCKCIDINPVRHEQIAVGALDAYVRLYDARILSLKRSSQEVSHQADPGCLAHFAPGHISNPRTKKVRRAFNNLATTFVAFSPDGKELLVNLSGEHVYLYDTTLFREALRYTFDKSDSSSIPKLQSRSDIHVPMIPHSSNAARFSVHRLLTIPFCQSSPHQSNLSAASIEESEVSDEVKELKEAGNVLYKEGRLSAAIHKYSDAILLCPVWHILYSNRATALYGRKW